MRKIADRVEDRIQNAILITIDNIVAPKILNDNWVNK